MNPELVPLTRYIGRCVYCGSTESLTDEHIVPHGLKGPWQLLKGSCQACNQITSAFEKRVLREQFILPRAVLGLPTYHPKNVHRNSLLRWRRTGIRKRLSCQELNARLFS